MTVETLRNNIFRQTGNMYKKYYKRADRISLEKKYIYMLKIPAKSTGILNCL